MGIPGTNESREMSSSLNDNENHSPVSIAIGYGSVDSNGGSDSMIKNKVVNKEEDIKPPNMTLKSLGEHSKNGIMNGTNSNQSLASSVTSHPPGDLTSPLKGDISSEDIDIINNSDDIKPFDMKPPEPNLKERLRRIKATVLAPLIKHPKSQAFRTPVNAKALGIYPIYYQIVKHPMDLGTVRKKIDALDYRSRDECMADIQLIWDNAKLFNAKGHFVHEAALVMEVLARDKLAKLEKNEADGIFDLPKLPKKEVDVRPREVPRPERRPNARKVSTDFLPGENSQPQQLKKKYVENLSEQLKQCDAILKRLMSGKKSYVEPFRRSRKYQNGNLETMNLYKIQERLQNGYYRHPIQFGNDFRRLITETYRFCDSQDPLIGQASELQHQFEILFCRVDFEPVENPSCYDMTSEDEIFHNHLLSVQAETQSIEKNVTSLIKDLTTLRSQNVQKKRSYVRQMKNNTNNKASEKQKRGRPSSSEPPSKKAHLQQKPLCPEESLALRAEVAELNEEQQQKIVQIMVDNNETLSTDANGYTEIDLGNCSTNTVRQIQAFIKKVKPKESNPGPSKRTSKSPVKKKGDLTDSSSDSSDDDDDSSNSSSSSTGSETD